MKKMNYLYKGYFTVIKGYVYGLLAFLGVGILLSIPMMLMWNWLMPFIFGLPKLNLLQTFGLSVLVNMFTSKLDINSNRIVSGLLNKSNNTIEFTFEPRKYNGTELKTASILKQLNKIFQNDTIKIYNQEKNYYYIELNGFILKNFDINKIELDNSEFINMYDNKH